MEKELFHLILTPENTAMVIFGTAEEASEGGVILRSTEDELGFDLENQEDFLSDYNRVASEMDTFMEDDKGSKDMDKEEVDDSLTTSISNTTSNDFQNSKSINEHPNSSIREHFLIDDQNSNTTNEHMNSPVSENVMDVDQDSSSSDSSVTSPPRTNSPIEELAKKKNISSVKKNLFGSPSLSTNGDSSVNSTSVISSPRSSPNPPIAASFDINAENSIVHFKSEMTMHKGHNYECNLFESNGKFMGFIPAYIPSGNHICECPPPGDAQWTYMVLRRKRSSLQLFIDAVYCAPVGTYKGQEIELYAGQLHSPLLLVENEKSSKGPSGKFHSCFYCETMFVHISRHLINRHGNEPEVQDLLQFTVNSKERNDRLKELRLRGDGKHNKSVPKDQRVTVRKPIFAKTSDCISCPRCLALLAPRNYSRHERNCSKRPPNKERVAQQSRLIEKSHVEDNENMKKKLMKILLDPLKDDPCSHEINSDLCLLQLAERYAFMHSNNPTSLRNDRQHLRRLARLLMEIRDIDSTIIDFEDCVLNVSYDSVIEAVYRLCDLNKSNAQFGKPSLAQALRSALTMLVRTLENYHLNRGLFKESLECRSIDRFLSIHNQNYGIYIGRAAGRHRLHRKTRQQVPLPEPNDIKLFSEYMAKEARSCYENLKNNGFSYTIWQRLGQAELGKIILFNRRRVSEVCLMYVDLFKKRTTLDESTKAGLTVLECALADKYHMMALLGKRAHVLHVLLDQEQCTHLELFLSFRKQAGVNDSNEYLFGVPNRSHYIDGSSVIRKFSMECNAVKPHLLRATYLRKQVATMSQLLTLNDNEIGQVARFMGHSKDVHNNFYRQNEKFTQVTSWAKFLSLAGEANINKYRGKTFEQIVNEVESLNVDEEEEDTQNSDQIQDTMPALEEITNDEVLTIIVETENFNPQINDIEVLSESRENSPSKKVEKKVKSSPKKKKKRGRNSPLKTTPKKKPTIQTILNKIAVTPPRRHLLRRKPFSHDEVKAMTFKFRQYICSGSLAPLHECEELVETQPNTFKNRCGRDLYNWVQYQRNKKRNKKL